MCWYAGPPLWKSESYTTSPTSRKYEKHARPMQKWAVDLRSHFSDLIEEEAFLCFHYRHRNELSEDSAAPATKCCPVAIANQAAAVRLLAENGKPWTNRNGEQDELNVLIRRVGVEGESVGVQPAKFKSNREKRKGDSHGASGQEWEVEQVSASVFFGLPEFHPPQETPQGNVGTCMRVFKKLLAECRLPPSVITKLGLVFVRDLSGRPYADVPFVYPDDGDDEEEDAEEWDRYEALHDDVIVDTEKAKERLYEEELEVIWDKGGPGEVWHTDTATWQAGEDSDPDLVDFDLDTRIHYKHNPAWLDMDTRQRADIFRREAEERPPGSQREPGKVADHGAAFESHSRGVGSKLLRKHGWRPGQGVGAGGREGIRTPLDARGKTPGDLAGLGANSATKGASQVAAPPFPAYRARYLPKVEAMAADETSTPPPASKEAVEEVNVPEHVLPPRRNPKLLLSDSDRELERQRALRDKEDADAEVRKRPIDDGIRVANGPMRVFRMPKNSVDEEREYGLVKYREVSFIRGAIQPEAAPAQEPLNPNPRFIDPHFNMKEAVPLTKPAPKR